ncbi:hypothetical protein [Parasediminibacterium sp. JCM 36343]|uniref:hypothetical protein n=1 Tax=Parasediminibacterium sp. JCM 36343 TaxID=3374279 RepID=UPI00397BE860
MFNIQSDILEIKFSGGDIKPDAIALSELSANILLLESLLKPLIQNSTPNFKFDSSIVGFNDLGNRSLSLRYILKSSRNVLIEAFTVLLLSVQTNDTSTLPSKTIKTLENISRFNSKYSCKVEFGETINGEFKPHANFTDQFSPEKTITVKGDTTIYGWIQWLGGTIGPTITLLLDNGETIDVTVKEEDLFNFKPHSNVGISGEATWKGSDLKLSNLVATEIWEFDKKNPEDGFKYLSKVFSDINLSTENI